MFLLLEKGLNYNNPSSSDYEILFVIRKWKKIINKYYFVSKIVHEIHLGR